MASRTETRGGVVPGLGHLTRGGTSSRRWVVQAWLGSRGLLALVLVGVGLTTGRGLGDMVSGWDVQHFLRIASQGYGADPLSVAFFPGWPLLLRGGLLLGLPPELVGVVLALLFSAVAAAALLRMGGPWAAAGWLFAPVAVFTAVPYTEAAFCAASFWAWERARAGRWPIAAALAALACSTRISGLFLVGALAVLAVTVGGRERWPARLKRLAWLGLPVAVLAGYQVFLWWLTGSPTAWSEAQAAGWSRGFHWPWETAANTWQIARDGNPDHPEWAWVFRAEIISMAVGLVATGWCLRRRLWAEAAYLGVQLLAFSVSFWWMSVNRAVLLWFPLWLMFAQLASRRARGPVRESLRATVLVLWIVASVAAMLVWAWLFSTGRWSS